MVIAEAPSESAAAFDKVDTSHLPGEIADLYKQLAREDLPVHQSPQVAQGLPYITGETVRQVLNQVLGIHRWSFVILSSEWDKEADHVLTHGRLTIHLDDRELVHEAYGGAQVKRSRSTGTPINLGFDFKSAQTEALKKAASDIGIGLWLSRKESAFWDAQEAGDPPKPGTTRSTPSRPTTSPTGASAAAASASANGSARQTSPNGSSASGWCEVCGDVITGQPAEMKDGWNADTLIKYSQNAFGIAACWPHYRALKAKKDGKDMPRGVSLPPESEWVKNKGQSTPAPTAARPAPKKDFLAELKAGLAKIAASKGDNQKVPADPEQIEWAEGVFYDAIGDSGKTMLAYLFGDNLSVADIDAIEEWTTVLDTDHWAERLEHAVSLLPQSQAA